MTLILQEQDLLATILTYHAVMEQVTSGMLSDGQTVQTLQTESLTAFTQGVFIDAAGESAQVTTADVATDNGVVHIINKEDYYRRYRCAKRSVIIYHYRYSSW